MGFLLALFFLQTLDSSLQELMWAISMGQSVLFSNSELTLQEYTLCKLQSLVYTCGAAGTQQFQLLSKF